MKKILLTLLAILCVAAVSCKKDDGGVTPADNPSNNTPGGDPSAPSGPTYVDLGLSVKWGTCNLGAVIPQGDGGYYAWGVTSTQDIYAWGTYTYCEGTMKSLTKYCGSAEYGQVDGLALLDSIDDAAEVLLGDGWRMPTADEMEELVDSCQWEWTRIGSISGCQVTGPNGNSIFLPASGYHYNDALVGCGEYGSYWTASLGTGIPASSQCLGFREGAQYMSTNYRFHGYSIRPVHP